MPVLFLSVSFTPVLPTSGFFPLTLPKPPTLPTPDSLGALSVGELNSPRVAPLPTPDSLSPNYRLPIVSLKAGRSDKRIR
ncbi:hypothetical protein [Moorena bouillonii]|uniref:hypothetical protein n=1 Tax=Moorena bouillonii TaxID=207920 RepID=UPI0011805979|nr:hypothetical protein [Moorena bouillonii]